MLSVQKLCKLIAPIMLITSVRHEDLEVEWEAAAVEGPETELLWPSASS